MQCAKGGSGHPCAVWTWCHHHDGTGRDSWGPGSWSPSHSVTPWDSRMLLQMSRGTQMFLLFTLCKRVRVWPALSWDMIPARHSQPWGRNTLKGRCKCIQGHKDVQMSFCFHSLKELNPTSLAASVSSAVWVTMAVRDRGTRIQIWLFCQLLDSSGHLCTTWDRTTAVPVPQSGMTGNWLVKYHHFSGPASPAGSESPAGRETRVCCCSLQKSVPLTLLALLELVT